MKNLVPSIVKRGLLYSAVIGGLLFQANCSGVSSSLHQYSGETIYETAIESNGDLLSYVPTIQSEVQKHLHTEEQEQAFEEFQQTFMTRLIKENPGFVDEFYDKMHSNDRREIDRALADAGVLLERELQKLVGDKKLNAKNVVSAVLDNEQVET